MIRQGPDQVQSFLNNIFKLIKDRRMLTFVISWFKESLNSDVIHGMMDISQTLDIPNNN